jgi:F0F1-type ATP synthase membrane subunit a
VLLLVFFRPLLLNQLIESVEPQLADFALRRQQKQQTNLLYAPTPSMKVVAVHNHQTRLLMLMLCFLSRPRAMYHVSAPCIASIPYQMNGCIVQQNRANELGTIAEMKLPDSKFVLVLNATSVVDTIANSTRYSPVGAMNYLMVMSLRSSASMHSLSIWTRRSRASLKELIGGSRGVL